MLVYISHCEWDGWLKFDSSSNDIRKIMNHSLVRCALAHLGLQALFNLMMIMMNF